MSKPDRFFSNMTRLFIRRPSVGGIVVGRPTRSMGWRYLHKVGIWRLFWNGGKHRVILVEHMSDSPYLPSLTEDDRIDLLLMGGPCTDPSDPGEGDVIAQMVFCGRNRAWMPRPSALQVNDANVLDFWMELDCFEVEVKGERDVKEPAHAR